MQKFVQMWTQTLFPNVSKLMSISSSKLRKSLTQEPLLFANFEPTHSAVRIRSKTTLALFGEIILLLVFVHISCVLLVNSIITILHRVKFWTLKIEDTLKEWTIETDKRVATSLMFVYKFGLQNLRSHMCYRS